MKSFQIEVKNGGVTYTDENKNIWIEEYIMKNEPTHILNGFIWALWGIYDYWLLSSDKNIKILFDKYCDTLSNNIEIGMISVTGRFMNYQILGLKCALVHFIIHYILYSLQYYFECQMIKNLKLFQRNGLNIQKVN